MKNQGEKLTDEIQPISEKKDRKGRGDAVSGGIFLIGLGVLIYTGWWWPGIMFVIGLSAGAGMIFRGKFWSGIGTMAFFFAIPFAIWMIQETAIPWSVVGPLILIGIGVIVIVKAFFLRD